MNSTSAACIYFLARNQSVQIKLQAELDDALEDDEDPVPAFEKVAKLPYLVAVINETFRVHSTAGLGLPRIVPEGGMTVLGTHFAEGTILSVPTYSIHRAPEVWGQDVETFRPERWLEGDRSAMLKAFNPFSFGPRCDRSLFALNYIS